MKEEVSLGKERQAEGIGEGGDQEGFEVCFPSLYKLVSEGIQKPSQI